MFSYEFQYCLSLVFLKTEWSMMTCHRRSSPNSRTPAAAARQLLLLLLLLLCFCLYSNSLQNPPSTAAFLQYTFPPSSSRCQTTTLAAGAPYQLPNLPLLSPNPFGSIDLESSSFIRFMNASGNSGQSHSHSHISHHTSNVSRHTSHVTCYLRCEPRHPRAKSLRSRWVCEPCWTRRRGRRHDSTPRLLPCKEHR